jgi:hypothetical protein
VRWNWAPRRPRFACSTAALTATTTTITTTTTTVGIGIGINIITVAYEPACSTEHKIAAL